MDLVSEINVYVIINSSSTQYSIISTLMITYIIICFVVIYKIIFKNRIVTKTLLVSIKNQFTAFS